MNNLWTYEGDLDLGDLGTFSALYVCDIEQYDIELSPSATVTHIYVRDNDGNDLDFMRFITTDRIKQRINTLLEEAYEEELCDA